MLPPPKIAKHGRYSDSLSRVNFRQRYETQISAPDLLSVRDEVALLDARLNDLLKQIDGQGVDFVQLLAVFQSVAQFAAIDDMNGVKMYLGTLNEIIQKGIVEIEIWKETYHVIEARRRLVETEMKTINTIGAMLSMEQVMSLINTVMAALSLAVPDQAMLAAAHAQVERVLNLTPNTLKKGATVDAA